MIFFGNYEKGIELSRELIQTASSLLEQLRLINKIAKVYNELAKPEEALAEAKRGLDLVKDIPEENLVGKEGAMKRNLYIRMSEAYRSAENYDLAEEYIRKTLVNCHIYYDSTPEEERGWTAMFLARILARKNDEKLWEEAAELFDEVLGTFKTLKNERAQGFGYMFLSQLSMKQKNYDKALSEIKKSYDLLSKYIGEVHLNIALIRIKEGNIHRSMGNEEKAVSSYRKAKVILSELNERKMVEKVDKIMESGKIGYLN